MWIGVMDRCMGTLKVGLKNNEFIQTLEPSSQVHLKATGDAEATVGLVAVDKAVYVLNSKPRLTQKKVWDTVEEHDSGCTADSGRDRIAVFKGAGLHLKVSTGMYTPASSVHCSAWEQTQEGLVQERQLHPQPCLPAARPGHLPWADCHCPQSPSLRSLKILETKRNAVNNFTTEMERRCCQAGLRESPVGLSSKKRARHVRHGPACVAAFRQCCQLSETLTREALEEQLLLGTTDEDKDLDDLFEDNTPVSTLFPESWLWKMFTSPKSESGREVR
ncbi:A.superbus venom factor 1-like isoform X4 [Ictidomys tridecemlineatus]